MLTLALLFACGKTPEVTHVGAASASASTGRPSGQADVSALTAVPSASGLTWYVLQPGSGAMAAAGDTVAVHYTGWLATGKKFDSSRDRGAPIKFVLGRGKVIKGWDEGVAGMLVGEQRQLHIPAELGYGSGAPAASSRPTRSSSSTSSSSASTASRAHSPAGRTRIRATPLTLAQAVRPGPAGARMR